MQSIEDLPPPPADARIAYGTKQNQFGDLRIPKGHGPHPTVIYIHGGFWRVKYDLTHAGHFCAALTDAGFATWSLEYRRIGEEGGGWPGTLEDVLVGARHLAKLAPQYHLDLTRSVLVGHSAGGQLALWAAAQDALPLVGVVSLAGVCDLRRAWELKLGKLVVEEFLAGPPERVPERYATASPIELLPMKVPQHLVHGTADVDVPFEISERFARASRNATLTRIEGAGHIELIDPRQKEWAPVLQDIAEW
jgi:acetyl esterase/lipase